MTSANRRWRRPTPPANPVLPVELIIRIVALLRTKQRFRVAIYLRLTPLYRTCIPRLPKMSIKNACIKGHVGLLDWWKASGLEMVYTSLDMDLASGCGRVAVLDWWKASGLELRYTSHRPELVDLNWWKASGLELRYTEAAMDAATGKGYVDVLEWWKNSGLEIRYLARGINDASRKGHVAVTHVTTAST
ncbi:hypothetical protein HDU90_001201 [Geranomyces variabilis]|nr:hypothetical protein HDU90_001201 [Geranomyces variabilis]